MNKIRGLWRIGSMAFVLAVGTAVILLTAWIPIHIRRIRLCAWPIPFMARLFLRVFRIQFICPEPEKFRQHTGFIFPNHVSFLDIIIFVALLPVRFVSKEEIRHWPFIGWIAQAIGTVFVDRENKASREQTRQRLAHTVFYPPVVLFPEGRISNRPDQLLPFRFGAFEIAVQHQISILPCVLLYDPVAIMHWYDEPFFRALWRVATAYSPLRVELIALPVITPKPNDDPRQLAVAVHGVMDAIIRHHRQPGDVIQEGL